MDQGANLKLIKRCRICGDKSLGFNFSGLSCESCKAFFRRNAISQKLFQCVKKDGKCQISMSNRRSCQACRLKKCYEVGMRKELIVLERERRNSSNSQNCEKEYLADDSLKGIPYKAFPLPELQRLMEVKNAMATEFTEESTLPVAREIEEMYEAFNKVSVYVTIIVRFCKQISAFECMTHDDQLNILKHFYFDILALRFSFLYNEEKDAIPIYESEKQEKSLLFKVSTLKQWKSPEIYPIFRKFYISLKAEMEDDSTIRDLIAAQSLFSSTKNISCPEFVRYQYFVYSYLLKMYLLCKFENLEKANAKYTALMTLLREGIYIREIITEVYSAMEISKNNPVLAEIYNLI